MLKTYVVAVVETKLTLSSERQNAYPDAISFARPERVLLFSAILNTSC